MLKRTFQAIGVLAVSLLIAQSMLVSSCATIVPPEGGPRDSLPPVLLRATPADSTRGFDASRITLYFDEYIGDVNDYYQNLIVSPLPQSMPTVTAKLREVTIRFRDSLQPNTTYTLDFGNTLKDVNEGNIFRNFTYTFTTGNYFDSLTLAGKVIFAETGETDSIFTVMLHTDPTDSAVVNKKPKYIARTNKSGIFQFRNLPPATYYIYALKDEGQSYRYMNPATLFEFANAPVQSGQADSVVLYAYAKAEPAPATASAPSSSGNNRRNREENRLQVAPDLEAGKQDILRPFKMRFSQPLKEFDSTKVYFTRDSAYTPVTNYRWETDSTLADATLHYAWQENTWYHLIFEKDFATTKDGYQLLKKDTLSFTTKGAADYGQLTIRFSNLEQYQNPVLQFIQNKEVKAAFPLSGNIFSQNRFLPGDYNLRILEDRNQNTIWDPGDFFNGKIQPEIAHPVDRKITVRASWENDFEIRL